MPIRAVGFDIDGTLYPSSALYIRMVPQALRSLKLLKTFSEVRHELRRLNPGLPFQKTPPESIDEFHRFQASMVAKRLGWDVETAYRTVMRIFYRESFIHFDRIPLFPGARRCLEDLRAAGLKLGALSDFPCDHKLALMKLDGHFDVAMTSEETGLVKPDRAPFDRLANLLDVKNDELLYVGNSESYDVAGAKAAGMGSALISRSRRARASSKADFTFRTYGELTTYILGLMPGK